MISFPLATFGFQPEADRAPSGKIRGVMAKTDDAYRAFCRDLMKLGVSQKTIAAAADHGSGWVNKWLTKAKKGSLTADDIDRLDRYFEQFARLMETRPALVRRADRERKAV